MIENQRHLFDLPDEVAYLRCAASAPQLKSIYEAGRLGLAKKSRPWRLGSRETFDDVEHLRTLFADLIGAAAGDVALVPSASYGLSTAAANLAVGEGRDVILLARQFPSNVYPWRALVRRGGGRLLTVERAADDDWTSAVLAAIGPATAVVALPQCHWLDGAMLDLDAIGRRAREVGAALVLDLSQSLGAVPFDVATVQPDFAVAVAEKWLLGPYQLAFFYAAPSRQDGEPIEHTWIGRAESEDYGRLVDYRDSYQPGARRFDVGERGNFISVPMAVQALRQIADWRVDAIAATLRPLVDEVADRAAEIGLTPVPAAIRAPHMIGLRAGSGLPRGLGDRLADRDVFVSVRDQAIRVAPHVYNDRWDLDRLFSALTELL